MALVAAALLAAAVLVPGAAGASPADGVPFGSLDSVQSTTGSNIRVTGWAADADAPATALAVHIYVDGVATAAVTANTARADVGAAFPGYGSAHGYDHTLAVGRGGHTVCTYAINVGGRGGNALLGCKGVQVGHSPFGNVESWSRRPGGVFVSGWALDPDTTASINIHVYVDGAFATAFTANGPRPDVAAAFGKGPDHGFTVPVPVNGVGNHQVCVYGIDADGDANGTVGCVTVTLSGDPFGSLDVYEQAPGGVRIAGWIIDPDTASSTRLDVYVDGVYSTYPANLSRPDIAAAFPAYGANHGFDGIVLVNGPVHNVCGYLINVAAPGGNVAQCMSF